MSSAPDRRYLPALDGMRALAVAAVFVFHADRSLLPGGYLGVDVFFVISGFIITRLLLEELEGDGRIRLASFWGRRAKRLLPGLLLVLAAVALVAMVQPSVVSPYTVRSDGIAALLYYANWHLLSAGHSYFSTLGAVSPFQHTWSLAIEEQFYVVWPLLLLAMAWVSRRLAAGRGQRAKLLAFGLPTALLGAASIAAMVVVSGGGRDVSTAYYATQCRGFELLAGALAAVVLRFAAPGDLLADLAEGRLGRGRGRLLQGACLAAAAAVLVGFGLFGGPPRWLYAGGLAAFAVAVAVMLVGSLAPGHLRRALSLRPLRWTGKISYEIYLWHFPVIVILARELPNLGGARLVGLDAAVTVVLAALSYRLVDAPLRGASYASLRTRLVGPVGVAATAALVLGTVPATATVAESAASLGTTRASVITVRSVFGEHLPAPVGRLGGLPPASRRHPLRLMFVGDSVMYQLELSGAAAVDATGEARTVSYSAIPGWGPRDSIPWSRFTRAIAATRPEVVLALWTQDNQYADAHGVRGEEAVMDRFVRMLLGRHDGVRGVVFVAQPPQPPKASFMAAYKADVYDPLGARNWAKAAIAETRAFPGQVAYLPVTAVLALHGRYATWLPAPGGAWRRVRQMDDFHLCLNGAVRYGMSVADGIEHLAGIAPPSRPWWDGSWAKAVRFDHLPGFPPGQCPADAPSKITG